MSNVTPRRVSSRDVAREAGVSQSTVSLVISGKTDTRISEETRQRVLSAAQRLNYVRNAAARALVTGKTHRIGIVPTHPHCFLEHGSYYGHLLDGMMEGVLRHNYNFLLHSSRYPDWQALFQDIWSGGEDGVLLIGRAVSDPLTRELVRSGFPTVCASYQPDVEGFHGVDCDNEQGGYLAVRHLLDLGHRHIAIEDADEDNSWIMERRQGAERAIAEAGLPPAALRRLTEERFGDRYAPAWPGEIARVVQDEGITGLVWHSESAAELLTLALPEQGIRVPDDLSIVCFDSTDISRRARLPLTSVFQPLSEIGIAAVDRVIALVEDEDPTPGVLRLPVALDIRQSSGPAPQRGDAP